MSEQTCQEHDKGNRQMDPLRRRERSSTCNDGCHLAQQVEDNPARRVSFPGLLCAPNGGLESRVTMRAKWRAVHAAAAASSGVMVKQLMRRPETVLHMAEWREATSDECQRRQELDLVGGAGHARLGAHPRRTVLGDLAHRHRPRVHALRTCTDSGISSLQIPHTEHPSHTTPCTPRRHGSIDRSVPAVSTRVRPADG